MTVAIRGNGSAYLGLHVVERWRADDGKADEEDVSLRVRERSEPVIIFLSSSVPKSQANWLSIDHNTRRVVVEAGRDTRSVVVLTSFARSANRAALSANGSDGHGKCRTE